MKNGRHIIWSNDIDYDDWREDLEEQYPDLTETERMELMYCDKGQLEFQQYRPSNQWTASSSY